MNIDDMIRENEVNSVRAYQRRQGLEMIRQQNNIEIQKVEAELMFLDGEARILSRIKDTNELETKKNE